MMEDVALIFHTARVYFGECDYLDQLEHDGRDWEASRYDLAQRLLAFGWGMNAAGGIAGTKMCEFETFLAKKL